MTIDLTHTIRTGMPVLPGDPEVSIHVHLDYEPDQCRVTRLAMGSHTGTHMDAPSHFLPGGLSLDRIPASRFVGRGVLADLRHLEPEAPITPQDLETALGGTRAGDFLVLQTGWDRFWGGPGYDRHPHVPLKTAGLLAEKGISLVGIDAPCIEKAPGGRYPVHRLLLEKQCLIVENLCGLGQIPDHAGWFVFLPLKTEEADGSPIRALYHPWP